MWSSWHAFPRIDGLVFQLKPRLESKKQTICSQLTCWIIYFNILIALTVSFYGVQISIRILDPSSAYKLFSSKLQHEFFWNWNLICRFYWLMNCIRGYYCCYRDAQIFCRFSRWLCYRLRMLRYISFSLIHLNKNMRHAINRLSNILDSGLC